MKLTYYIESRDQGPEDAQELREERVYGKISTDPEIFAVQAAEYRQDYRDGWEWAWPEVFVVLRDGQEVGRYEVSRENIPHFYASPIAAKHKEGKP